MVRKTLLISLFIVGYSYGGTMACSVADYNAAKVKAAGDVLVVPSGSAVVYTATQTLNSGSSFIVTLPAGIAFATTPALTTNSSATFTLTTGGVNAQSATFLIGTSNITTGQTITLAGYSIKGASALETITPVASALPVSMQAIGADTSPVSCKEFASDAGASAIFVNAIQLFDLNPPSNGSMFLSTPDTLTGVMSAIAISTQTTDFATNTVPILNADGTANTLNSGDTATALAPGFYSGFTPFTSTTSTCTSQLSQGSITPQGMMFPNIPFNREIFFCITGNGSRINLYGQGPQASGGYVSGPTYDITTLILQPGTSTDFVASQNVDDEFPGAFCYTTSTQGPCQAVLSPPTTPSPSSVLLVLLGLAAIALFFKRRAFRRSPELLF